MIGTGSGFSSAESWLVLLAIFLPLAVVPLILAAARKAGPATGWLAMIPAVVSLFILAWLAFRLEAGPRVLEVPWIPSIGLPLSFLIDGLSVFYGLVICGIGAVVCWYAVGYLDHPDGSHGRFYACLLIFMSAMLGTVLSDNLLTLFVFWEMTGVASFLLIGFFHAKTEARTGARRALLVTVATGLCLLIGIIMLGWSGGTYSISRLMAMGPASFPQDDGWVGIAFLLVMIGAFGKSAQFPFHFWLPGAMAAPTPVSAYLHSATMVKLGVFLTARIFPVFNHLDLWFPILTGICFTTMLLGAYLALRSNDLKTILAYSTVSQLGFLIGVYGLGGGLGVKFDFVHVLSHVFYKGALFMVAGVVDHSTGTRDVRRLGGLGKHMPLTMLACGLGAATMAGLPLTTGFISKELMLAELTAARADHPVAAWVLLAMLALSATMMVAFAARIFFGVFRGEKPAELHVHAPGWSLQIPPLLLVAAAVVFGVFPGWLQNLLGGFTVAGLQATEVESLHLWHGFTPELFTSLGILTAGAGLYAFGQRTAWRWAEIPPWLRFDRAFERAHDGLLLGAKKLTLALRADWPPAYLPIVITFFLLVPGVALFTAEWPEFKYDLSGWAINPLRALVAGMTICALLGVVFLPRWSAQLVALSIAGFFTTFYFVLYQAPDLAMTQILVESASVVMILLLLSRFPSSSQLGVRLDFGWDWRHLFRIGLSLGVGLLMVLLVLFSDLHRHPDPVGLRILEMSEPLAAGSNAVNTILVDFRGFDTLGEITVLLTATLGVLGLMMRYKRVSKADPKPPPGFLLGKKKQP